MQSTKEILPDYTNGTLQFAKHIKKFFEDMHSNKLCMGHRNKIKVPDPVVKDLISKK